MTEKVKFTLSGYEAITRDVSEIGNGAHVLVPRAWAKMKVKVILMEELNKNPDTKACD